MDERRVLAEDIFRRVCSKDNGRFDIFVRPLPRKKKKNFYSDDINENYKPRIISWSDAGGIVNVKVWEEGALVPGRDSVVTIKSLEKIRLFYTRIKG